jgi:ABC-type lipoprotein export system ATPase subunit
LGRAGREGAENLHHFSGEKQRVAIARALAENLLLADEPSPISMTKLETAFHGCC